MWFICQRTLQRHCRQSYIMMKASMYCYVDWVCSMAFVWLFSVVLCPKCVSNPNAFARTPTHLRFGQNPNAFGFLSFSSLVAHLNTSSLPSLLQSLHFGHATSVQKSITLPLDYISRRQQTYIIVCLSLVRFYELRCCLDLLYQYQRIMKLKDEVLCCRHMHWLFSAAIANASVSD